jgi:methanogenic corrinoid protein MtbC1
VVDRRALGQFGREPLYNTQAVVQRTGVPADTFRAWERRYGIPHPHRAPTNERLYSERDIAVIRWLRDRTDEGMTISRAIQRLRLEHPDLFATSADALPAMGPPPTPRMNDLSQRLVEAVVEFNDAHAERVIDESLALFSVEETCLGVIQPALVTLGELWERGKIPASVEHFATRIVQRRLAAIFTLVASASGHGTIVAACAPGEEHEIGLLMLATFLARRGWRVVLLGAGVPIDDLVLAIRRVRPDVVCLSAAMESAAQHALAAADAILAAVQPAPTVVYGGRAFSQAPAQLAHPALHLDGTPDEIAGHIARIVAARAARGQARRHDPTRLDT